MANIDADFIHETHCHDIDLKCSACCDTAQKVQLHVNSHLVMRRSMSIFSRKGN